MSAQMLSRRRLVELAASPEFGDTRCIFGGRMTLLGPIDWIDNVLTVGAPVRTLEAFVESTAPWTIAYVPIEPKLRIRKSDTGHWIIRWRGGMTHESVSFSDDVTFDQVLEHAPGVYRQALEKLGES